MAGAQTEFLGEPGAASRAGRHMGLQMAPAIGPALDTVLAAASPAMPALALLSPGITKPWHYQALALFAENWINKCILAAALAVALSVAAPPRSILAMTAIPRPANAIEAASPAQKVQVFCGPLGCGPI